MRTIPWAAGIAVLAVLVWRRVGALQKASMPQEAITPQGENSVPADLLPLAAKDRRETPRRIRRWLGRSAEPLFMVVMVAAGLGFGWHYRPADDPQPEAAGRLAVELPGEIRDTNKWADFKDVQWFESHEDAHQPTIIFPWPIEEKQPKLDPGIVRVRIAVDFYRELTPPRYPSLISDSPDLPIEVQLDLPENTDVVGCRRFSSTFDSRVKCDWADRPPPDYASSITKSVTDSLHLSLPKRYYRVKGVVPRDCTSMMFVIDFKKVPGLSFMTNRTRATVRLPGLVVSRQTPMPAPSNQALGVLVNDGIAAPGRYTWSQRPSAQTDDSELWFEATASNGPPITGVDDELLRVDHSHEFRSGIAFGLAGAAFIGLGQSVFSGCRERKRLKSKSRL